MAEPFKPGPNLHLTKSRFCNLFLNDGGVQFLFPGFQLGQTLADGIGHQPFLHQIQKIGQPFFHLRQLLLQNRQQSALPVDILQNHGDQPLYGVSV